MEDIIHKIIPILQQNDVSRAALFGSFVRGEERPDSDVDILIEFAKQKSLFDLVNLQYNLEDEIKKKVDLVTYRALHPYIKDQILAEQKTLYGKRF